MEHLGCRGRCFHGMETQHACRNSKLLSKCGNGTTSLGDTDDDEENCEYLELRGHIDSPSTFDKFLNVDKSLPKTGDQLRRLDSTDPAPCT
jgi:hypothetical protein